MVLQPPEADSEQESHFQMLVIDLLGFLDDTNEDFDLRSAVISLQEVGEQFYFLRTNIYREFFD